MLISQQLENKIIENFNHNKFNELNKYIFSYSYLKPIEPIDELKLIIEKINKTDFKYKQDFFYKNLHLTVCKKTNIIWIDYKNAMREIDNNLNIVYIDEEKII
jgi:hypothetical protein